MRTRLMVPAFSLLVLVMLFGIEAAAAEASGGTLTGSESALVVKPGNQFDPAISGPYVVFTDSSAGNKDIWYFDATDGSLHPAVTGPGDQQLTDIAAGHIAYTDNAAGNDNIAIYDIVTGTSTPITTDPADQSNPAISARLVAWEDLRGVDRDIWVHDLALGGDKAITGPGDQNSPAASGAHVVYIDAAAGNAVKLYDADTGLTTVTATGPAFEPDIDGNNVVFVDLSGPDTNIRVVDVAGAPKATLVLAGDQLNPHISGEWVAFEDLSTGTSHVALWHWPGGEVFYPTPTTSQQILNDISGNRVVYTDNRNGDLDIYAYDFTFVPSVGVPATLTLSPAADTNAVGTSHTVAATVTDASSQPVENVTVRFSVTGSVTTAGSCTTDASGQCSFTYIGPTFPGADLISAYADTNDNSVQDAGEPAGTATKAWVLPSSSPGQATGGGHITDAAGNKIAFGFTAKSDLGLKGSCTVVDQAAGRMIKCLDVLALVQGGNVATFWGNAADNGAATSYVIQVFDNGEPGRGIDMFLILTASGYSGAGTLTAGNVQVH